MLLDDIKARMFQAIKAGDTTAKEILRVAVGEITTEAARDGRKGDDDEARAILRKLLKSNEETLGRAVDDAQRATLRREIEVLTELLPRSMSEDDVVGLLEPVKDALRAAGNDGQATGIAMKHLKPTGAVLDGKTVSSAVKRIRA